MSTGVFQQPIRWAQRFLELGVREQDSRDERLRKAIVNLLALMVITGAPLEGWEAWHSGSSESVTLIFGCLTVMTAVGLAHMWSTGRRTLLQRSIFVLGLVSAGISHVEYGGAMGSMAYILWGSLTPVCALLLCSRREARFWTLPYLGIATGLIVAELYLDIPFTNTPRPATVWLGLSIPVFYFLTIVLVLDYFVLQLEKARKELQDEHERLQVEKARSERLLLNVLPAAIATRLKDENETIADDFHEVSVLFADIVGFTKLSAEVPARELIDLLNTIFSAF
ncbi:MAG: adenylate/guanylate cyclase domain-containing protein, partial [Myxococcota bacterium]|nr:adenylate/guanylate cyclase domain-containing protein [Myxococcota bacterium]